MIKNEYIEGAIYQDAHTPEKCIIVIEVKENWIYTYELNDQKSECLTNQFVNDKIATLLNFKLTNYKKNIPGVLPFFIGGYLGQIKLKLLKELQKDLKTSQMLGFI